MKQRLLLIGCGAVAEGLYAGALRKLESRGMAEVAGLVDPNPSRTAALQRLFRGAIAFKTPAEALEGVAPDLTIVASPPGHHAEHAVQALGAGSHVLCEKPMTTNVEDAERMVAAAREAGRVLAVGMVRRMFPSLALAKELVEGGALGDDLRFVYREGSVYGWPVSTDAAFRRATAGGGVLTDVGSHVLDFLAAIFGAPTVAGYADDAQADGVETNCRFDLGFRRADGTVQLSWSQPLVTGLQVVGSAGELRLEPGVLDAVRWRRRGGSWQTLVGVASSPIDLGAPPAIGKPTTYFECMYHQLIRTLRAVRYGEPAAVTGEDGLLVVRTIEGCYRRAMPLDLPWLSAAEQAQARERHWKRRRWAA